MSRLAIFSAMLLASPGSACMVLASGAALMQTDAGSQPDLQQAQVALRIQEATEEVVSHTGIKANFSVSPSDVTNALANIDKQGNSVLLYNPTYMARAYGQICKDWGIMGIIAHEIGHHLQGHILKRDAADFANFELEADDFAGFVMYRMGATLEEAQRSTNQLVAERGSTSHPGKAQRLKALETGWLRARAITAHEHLASEQRQMRSPAAPPDPSP